MSLTLSTKKARRYNARQLKKWHAKNSDFIAYKKRLLQAVSSEMAVSREKAMIRIDLNGIRSVEDFYQRLAATVTLPSYAAANLDALHDGLLGDISESLQFVWSTVLEDLEKGSSRLEGLREMLESLPQARDDILISYKGCSN